jgi:hypothetical protein
LFARVFNFSVETHRKASARYTVSLSFSMRTLFYRDRPANSTT